MTDIRFYHLTTRLPEQALPDLVQKALSGGHRIVVRTHDRDVERLNDALWAQRPDSFIPHGSKKDGHAALQPVWLTAGDDNPNGAGVLILAGGVMPETVDGFALVCDVFDGRDETQLSEARGRWKRYKDAGHTLTYWQQGEKGWEQKA